MPLLKYRRRYLVFGLAVSLAAAVVLGLILSHPSSPGTQAASPEVKMSYSGSYANSVGGGLQPPPGSTFLIIHLNVENKGYQNFTANPLRDMYVEIGGQAYNVSAPAYVFLANPFPRVNLNDTQIAIGDLAFQVPQGSSSFLPQWRIQASAGIRLDWVAA